MKNPAGKKSCSLKFLATLALAVSIIAVGGVLLSACTKSHATYLRDGQTLSIVDNTLGEGQNANGRFTYSYKNETKAEQKGSIVALTGTDGAPDRYFAYVHQKFSLETNGTPSTGTVSADFWIELTGLRNGAVLGAGSRIGTRPAGATNLLGEGENTTMVSAIHHTTVSTYQKIAYEEKNRWLTVWRDRTVTIKITSPTVYPSAADNSITVTLNYQYSNFPYCLTQKGDSWKVV